MQNEIATVNSFTRRIEVSIPWEDLIEKYQAFTKKFSKKVNLPGYRKGKVPAAIIKKQYGHALDYEFTEEVLQQFYLQAIAEHKLFPINAGDIEKVHFHEGEPLNFTASFEVEPEVQLPNYTKGMKFKQIIFERDDEDVDYALKDIQQRHSQLKTIDGGAEEGHFLMADLQELDESGLPIIGNKIENQYIQLSGDGPFGGDNLKNLLGAQIDDTRRITLPGEGGTTRLYDVTIRQVTEQILPDLDDAFADEVEPDAETMDDLRRILGERIDKSFERESNNKLTRDIADYFIEGSDLEMPTSMYNNYIDNLIDDMIKQGYDEKSIDREMVEEEHKASIIWNIKWYLLRKAILAAEDISVTDEDVDGRIKEMTEQDGAQAQQIKNYYRRPENKRSLREDIITDKLMDRLKELSKIKVVNKPSSEMRKMAGQQ
ncbi:trigger factor [Candidatus Neomarinimicrobiota bacterium]